MKKRDQFIKWLKEIYAQILEKEKKIINFFEKYKMHFLKFIITVHLGLFAWSYPEIVSSAFFVLLSVLFGMTIDYSTIEKIFFYLFTKGKNPEKTKRIIFYTSFSSILIHSYLFKPNSKFLNIFLNDGQQK